MHPPLNSFPKGWSERPEKTRRWELFSKSPNKFPGSLGWQITEAPDGLLGKVRWSCLGPDVSTSHQSPGSSSTPPLSLFQSSFPLHYWMEWAGSVWFTGYFQSSGEKRERSFVFPKQHLPCWYSLKWGTGQQGGRDSSYGIMCFSTSLFLGGKILGEMHSLEGQHIPKGLPCSSGNLLEILFSYTKYLNPRTAQFSWLDNASQRFCLLFQESPRSQIPLNQAPGASKRANPVFLVGWYIP